MNLFPFALLPYFQRGKRGQKMAWWENQRVACGNYLPREFRRYTADRIYVAQKICADRHRHKPGPRWTLFTCGFDGLSEEQHREEGFAQLLPHVGPIPPTPSDPFVVVNPIHRVPMIVSPTEYRVEHGYTGQIALTISLLGGLGRFTGKGSGALTHLRFLERTGVLDLYAEHRRLEILGPLAKDLEDSPDKILCTPGQIDLEAYRRGWDDLLRKLGASW
jgi:hypothetical protein